MSLDNDTATDLDEIIADLATVALEATLTSIKGTGWSSAESLKAIKTLIDLLPTGVMRGTDNALLAASYVTERGTDSAMLATDGALEATLTTIKGVSWSAETLKAIYDLIASIPTTAMRGTDGAALASAWTSALATALAAYTAARGVYLDELAAANIPADIDTLKTGVGTTIPNQITGLNNISTADVNSQVDGALNTEIPGSPVANSINERLVRIDTNTAMAVNNPVCDTGMAASTTVIVSEDLAGLTDDFLNTGYKLKIIRDANNHGSALEGQVKDITDYTSLTGTITCAAFSQNVEEGDAIAVIMDEIADPKTLLENATYGLSAIETLVDELETRLTAARAGYLDELDFDLDARLGSPAGASLAADLLTIDNLVDDLESRITAQRGTNLDELGAANIPADVDTIKADVVEAKYRTFKQTFNLVTTVQSVSSTDETTLTPPATVTPTFPTGATLVKSYVVAQIKALNQSAAAHNIFLTLQDNIAAGGMTDVLALTTTTPLGLPAVSGASDSLCVVETTNTITSGQSITFGWQVDSDNAGAVIYTSTFVLVMEYDFR